MNKAEVCVFCAGFAHKGMAAKPLSLSKTGLNKGNIFFSNL
jgi:hypothetical protein